MPERETPGPDFLDEKYGNEPEFQTAVGRSAEQAARRSDGESVPTEPSKNITNYLERLRRIAAYRTAADAKRPEGQTGSNPDPRLGVRQLKSLLHTKYVIQPDQIPDDYIKEVILGNFAELNGYERQMLRVPGVRDSVLELFAEETKTNYKSLQITPEQRKEVEQLTVHDQQSSLDIWLDYLVSAEADNYPPEFRYWVMAEVLKCGPQDRERKRYKDRRPDTTASFPELNQQALALVLDEVARKYAGRSSQLRPDLDATNWQAYRSRLQGENFSSLYGWMLDHVNQLKLPQERLVVTKGAWQPFVKGTKDAEKELVTALQGSNTGWCIAGEGTATSYLQHSQIWVYFSEDQQGNQTIPRVAVVTDGKRISEVRGILQTKDAKQHLDDYIAPLVEKQLEGMTGGEAWLDTMQSQRQLARIHLRNLRGTFQPSGYEDQNEFQKDLKFLYEIDKPITATGYGADPRIAELRNQRNPNEDAPIIFGCEPDQIAHAPDAIGPDTKAYVGPLSPGIFGNFAEHKIEFVYTTFPKGKIEFLKNPETGKLFEFGGKSPDQLESELQSENIGLYGYATDLLTSDEMKASLVDATGQLKESEPMRLVRMTVADLGFPQGATTKDILGTAEHNFTDGAAYRLGLELCPPEVGPQLRLQSKDPRWMLIAMRPLGRDGAPGVFFLLREGVGRLELSAYDAEPDERWDGGSRFVFSIRK